MEQHTRWLLALALLAALPAWTAARVTSLGVAILNDNRIAYRKSFGWRDKEDTYTPWRWEGYLPSQ